MFQAKQPSGHAFRSSKPSTRPRNPYARAQVPRQQQPPFQKQQQLPAATVYAGLPAAAVYTALPTTTGYIGLQPTPLIPGLGEVPQHRRRTSGSHEQRGQNRSQPYERPSRNENRPSTYPRKTRWESASSTHKAPSYQNNKFSAPRVERTEVAADTSEQTAQEPTFICDICDMKCNSEYIYEQHMKGKAHQKKIKRLELEKLWEKKDPSAYCKICDLALNPASMEMHLAGVKHKELAENAPEELAEEETGGGQDGENSQSSRNSLVVNVPCELCSITLDTLGALIRHFNSKPHMKMCVEKYLEEKRIAEASPFYCNVCELALNGQKTYDAHVEGIKHKNKLANAGYDPNDESYGTEVAMETYDAAYPREIYTSVFAKPQFIPFPKPPATAYVKPRKSDNVDQTNVYADPYTASKFDDQTKTQDSTYTSAFARDIPHLYCDICDVSFNGQKPYEDHIQGYRHNYKLTNGNFDPNSAFGKKCLKMKAKLARKRQMEENMLENADQEMDEPPFL